MFLKFRKRNSIENELIIISFAFKIFQNWENKAIEYFPSFVYLYFYPGDEAVFYFIIINIMNKIQFSPDLFIAFHKFFLRLFNFALDNRLKKLCLLIIAFG